MTSRISRNRCRFICGTRFFSYTIELIKTTAIWEIKAPGPWIRGIWVIRITPFYPTLLLFSYRICRLWIGVFPQHNIIDPCCYLNYLNTPSTSIGICIVYCRNHLLVIYKTFKIVTINPKRSFIHRSIISSKTLFCQYVIKIRSRIVMRCYPYPGKIVPL